MAAPRPSFRTNRKLVPAVSYETSCPIELGSAGLPITHHQFIPKRCDDAGAFLPACLAARGPTFSGPPSGDPQAADL